VNGVRAAFGSRSVPDSQRAHARDLSPPLQYLLMHFVDFLDIAAAKYTGLD